MVSSGLTSRLTQPTTPQSQSETENGFLALAEFDRPENAGNADGLIDFRDAVFSKLLLWVDANHNGLSEPSELRGLSQCDIIAIHLDYKDSHFVDKIGNSFKYRAKVDGLSGRWAYDVFLELAPR